jgi:tetratricopeptide (TPR) repeat protein
MDIDKLIKQSQKAPYFKINPYEGSNKLAVIFSTVGVKPGYFTFYKTMESIPVHKIYLTDPNSEWFQSGIPGLGATISETIESIKKVKEYLGATEVYTIGSSMGGYGSILYGALMDCTALAFGARVELGIKGSQSYTLANRGFNFKYKDLRPLVADSRCHVTIYQGEADVNDLLAANQLYPYKNVECVTIKGVAHATPVFLNNKYGIKEVISRFVEGNPILEFDERGNILTYDNAVEILFAALELMASKNWDTSVKVLNSLLEIDSQFDVAHHKLGIAYYQLRDFNKAFEHQQEAVNISPHFANAQHQLGICLRKLGNYKESYEAHKKAYELDPKLAGAHHHAGLSLEKLHLYEEAENEFRKAVELSKNNKKYLKKLVDTLQFNSDRKLKEVTDLMVLLES